MGAAENQAHEEGQGARRAGKARKDNPFPVDDPKHSAWNDGYRAQKQLQYHRAYGLGEDRP